MRIRLLDGARGPDPAAQTAHALHTLLEALGLPEKGDRLLFSGKKVACPLFREATVELPCGEAMSAEEAIRIHRRIAAEDASLIHCEGDRVRVGADILGAAAFWLTGAHEAGAPCDPFGRPLGARGVLARAGLLAQPPVDGLLRLLWDALSRAAQLEGSELERIPAWPDDHRFAVLLSHDVDLWRKRTPRQLAKELLRAARDPRRLPRLARAFTRGPDPWADLDAIADLEAGYSMRSTFFVFAGRPNLRLHGIGIVNSYDAPREAVGHTLRRLAERGWEVALHGSYQSFDSPSELRAEKADLEALLGQEVWGCRQHFLRFAWPATWLAQAEAGLRYDATLGYHDADGCRAGLSFPFRAHAGQELPLLVLPLVVADGALREHEGLGPEAAWERLKTHLERTAAQGSMLGILWHNTHFCELDAPGYPGVYERVLDWTRSHGGWGASARDILTWWEKRAALLAPRALALPG